jgi:hypothetical protein
VAQSGPPGRLLVKHRVTPKTALTIVSLHSVCVCYDKQRRDIRRPSLQHKTYTEWARSVHSLRQTQRSAQRTKRTCGGAAIADAAFARNRGDDLIAVRHCSPKQPFKRVNRAGSQTGFSPHGAGTHMSRDRATFRCIRASGCFSRAVIATICSSESGN